MRSTPPTNRRNQVSESQQTAPEIRAAELSRTDVDEVFYWSKLLAVAMTLRGPSIACGVFVGDPEVLGDAADGEKKSGNKTEKAVVKNQERQWDESSSDDDDHPVTPRSRRARVQLTKLFPDF